MVSHSWKINHFIHRFPGSHATSTEYGVWCPVWLCKAASRCQLYVFLAGRQRYWEVMCLRPMVTAAQHTRAYGVHKLMPSPIAVAMKPVTANSASQPGIAPLRRGLISLSQQPLFSLLHHLSSIRFSVRLLTPIRPTSTIVAIPGARYSHTHAELQWPPSTP